MASPFQLYRCLRATLACCCLLGALTPTASAAPPNTTEIVRLQVFLDNHHFGPGAIDGHYGTFTKRALAYYNTQQKRRPSDLQSALTLAEKEVPFVFATHQITGKDLRWIGPVPTELDAQAALKRLPYGSLKEYLAERYHARLPFLQRLNPNIDLDLLKKGDLVVVPNVKHIFRIEALPKSKRFRSTSKGKDRYVYINTAQKIAGIYEGTTLLAAFPITHGRPRYVPRGRWVIRTMVTTPTFRWDERMLKEGQRSDRFHLLPPGPNNPVGILWAGINKPGIGLHGTNDPESIGRSHSAGCIRLANWDAVRLPDFLSPGAEVIIR